MKQIIVNVSRLSVEEKQRVNEALAKITGATKLPLINSSAGWFFAPASSGANTVSWGWSSTPETPTHTPQRVLEMAGMTEKRKVRADFDKRKEYSVDVSNCTEDEKKEVQQAFFDAGFLWQIGGNDYLRLNAVQYSNTTRDGLVTGFCLSGATTKECNMSPEEFFSYVCEPEQKGHTHADLMALYAEDAKTTDKPWELWQVKDKDGVWWECKNNPLWGGDTEYRRKPKTKIINGVEIPDFQFTPFVGCEFYCANPGAPEFHETGHMGVGDCTFTKRMVERGLIYPYTEEGKQAAILHAKSWLGIA